MINGVTQIIGASLIAKERSEQIHKHGRTIEQDIAFNNSGELVSGAIAILTLNPEYYPSNWSEEFWDKMVKSGYNKQVCVAGALLAAELDRRLNSNQL